MTPATHHRRAAGTPPRSDPLALAWTAVALIPVVFFVGFALGQGLYTAFGYKPENDDAPLWVDLVVALAALTVTLIPCVAAMVYGRRASKAGRQSARVPITIGAVAGASIVILTALST